MPWPPQYMLPAIGEERDAHQALGGRRASRAALRRSRRGLRAGGCGRRRRGSGSTCDGRDRPAHPEGQAEHEGQQRADRDRHGPPRPRAGRPGRRAAARPRRRRSARPWVREESVMGAWASRRRAKGRDHRRGPAACQREAGILRRVRVIGLMSGTSADGVDAALVEWPDGPEAQPFRLLRVREDPLRAGAPASASTGSRRDGCRAREALRELAALDVELGERFAAAARAVAAARGLALERVDAIASHGQTVGAPSRAPRHAPDRRPLRDRGAHRASRGRRLPRRAISRRAARARRSRRSSTRAAFATRARAAWC